VTIRTTISAGRVRPHGAPEMVEHTSLRNFLAAVDALPDPVLLVSSQLDVEQMNSAACRLLRRVESDGDRMSRDAWLPEDSAARLLDWLASRRAAPLTFTVTFGGRRALTWVSATAAPLNIEGRGLTVLQLREVVPGEEWSDADREDYRRLREAVTTRQIGIYEHNHITDELYGSGEVRAQYGIGPTEPLSIRVFAGATHPEDADFLVSEIAKAHAPGGDGVFDVQHRILLQSGETRWLHTRARTRFETRADGSRQLSLTTGSVLDITQRKNLEDQLLHSQKLEAVGTLAGGIAHDFNNLLSVILGFTALVLRGKDVSEKVKTQLGEVLRAGERASELTRQLLSFSRKQMMRPKVVQFDDVLLGVEPMLERLVDERIDVAFHLNATDARVHADPTQVEQVLINLVVNARDAISGPGCITIESETIVVDATQSNEDADLMPGRYAMIAVSDTGNGIAPDVQAHVFEPFFTTKPQGAGTGLGLSTVFGIVKQSGGSVSLFSEPGHGTTFKVFFPTTTRPITQDEPASVPPRQASGETVLVVEDEAQLRRMLVSVLEEFGYRAVAPAGPVEALSIAREKVDEIALVLTDVVMPQMTGRQLADALASEGSPIPILFMSGYTEDSIVTRGVLDDGVNFLPKPITPERLRAAVQRAVALSPRNHRSG